jgi:hypothetical protein
MHHAVTLQLKVDALAGRVGGEQDADWRPVGWSLELRLDTLALVGLQPPVQ